MARQEIKAIVFDVMGTMCDMTPLRAPPLDARMEAIGFSKAEAQVWDLLVQRDGDTLAMSGSGGFATNKDIGAYHLRNMLKAANSHNVEAAVKHIQGGADEVRPYPDTEGGLRALKAKGLKIATMTNSTTSFSQAALKRGNCDTYIDTPLDISMVQRWKPHPSVYQFAAKQLGFEPHEVMMIAAHPWDIHGALAAGLRATYVDRPKTEYPPYYIKPDFIIPSLKELADLPIGAPPS